VLDFSGNDVELLNYVPVYLCILIENSAGLVKLINEGSQALLDKHAVSDNHNLAY